MMVIQMKVPKPNPKKLNLMNRWKRLNCYVYVEGNPNPIDLSNIDNTNLAILRYKLVNLDLKDLFTEKEKVMDLIVKYMPYLVIIVLIAFILFGK